MTNQPIQQLQPGALLQAGKYRIEKMLGQGGFGITYLATQELLDRRVAIKEFFMRDFCSRGQDTASVTLGTASNREFMERYRAKFLKEAKVIARLDHPNIVRIHDIFEENGPGKSQFHGGFGLTNTLGIRKPSYHAYRFLSRMKGRIVYRSDKALVVEDGKVMHALFWNYCHYEEEFQDGDRRALTATCRDVFEKRNEDFLLDIDGLEAVECLLLGPSHGSVFDLWTERGAKEDLSPSEAEELSSLAEPARVPFSPGFTLGPHEVLYVEFSSGLSTSRMPSEA